MDEVCGICRDIDHTSVACPFLRYCTNVKPAAPGTVSYANVTKTLAAAAPKPKKNSQPTVAIPLLNDQTKKATDNSATQ